MKSLWCERKDMLCFRNRVKAMYSEHSEHGKEKQGEGTRSQSLAGHVKEYEFYSKFSGKPMKGLSMI